MTDVNEAKVDTGTPEEKEKTRNVRKFGVSHNVAGHGKLRRALHRSDRGHKKIKGDKPQLEQEGVIALVKKGKAKHDEAVEKKKVKQRKAVPYAALAQSYNPKGETISEEEYDRIKDRRLERGGSAPGGDDPSPRSSYKSSKKYDPKAAKKASDQALKNVRAAIIAQHGPGAIAPSRKEEWEAAALEVAVDYFYEEGINEEGLDLIIEEVGLEDFVEYILDPPPEYLEEERAARKASASAPSYEKVKAKVDAGDAARRKSGKGEYAKTAAAKRNYGDEDNTNYDEKKPAAKKKAAPKAKPKAKPKVVEIRKKVEKSVPKAKKEQPKKKPEKKGLYSKLKDTVKKGVDRHKEATGKLKKRYVAARAKGKVPEKRAKEFAKGVKSGVKATVKFAKDVKKVVGEEVVPEGYDARVDITSIEPIEEGLASALVKTAVRAIRDKNKKKSENTDEKKDVNEKMTFSRFIEEGNKTVRQYQKSKTQVTGHISADRGDSEKKNRASRKSLEKDLKKHGIGHSKGKGKYKYDSGETGTEVSYQTSKSSKMSKRRFGKVMRRLGRKHGQESVITKDKDKPARLHDTEAKKPGKSINIGKSKPGSHPKGEGETSGTKVRSGKLPKKTSKGAYHYG